MFVPDVESVGGFLWLTALVATLPIVGFFALVGAMRMRSHLAGVIALVLGILLAIVAFRMPVDMALSAAALGALNGLIPIVIIVIAAVWLHKLMEATGREVDLQKVFSAVGSGDLRLQAMLIALCFGGLLEGLAGFGVPVAIVAALLMGLGFEPKKAAVIALVANTSPVAYAAFGVPITTAASLMTSGTPTENAADIATYVSVLEPGIAFVMPFMLTLLIDKNHFRQMFPLAFIMGVTEGAGQFLTLRFISFELGGVLPPIVTFLVIALLVRLYQPDTPEEFLTARPGDLRLDRVALAVMPYALVILVLSVGRLVPVVAGALSATDLRVAWPGLAGRVASAVEPETATNTGNVVIPILSQPGVLIAVAAIVTGIVFTFANEGGKYALGWRRVLGELGAAIYSMRFSAATIVEVIALAYVMNISGMVLTIGTLLARTGIAFLVLSPMIGYLGTAVSGSATSANALFAALQETTALQIGLPGAFAVAVNTAGGVIGKLIAPQSLAIAAAAMGEPEKEGELLGEVIGWSLYLLLFAVFFCVVFGLLLLG
ncbi:MAG: L-lactate permease [Mobiluncus porci]|uniref:L-lactate permease n=1 Tax=Mobiluncus porci TaxID=2652278 RepID=UPI0023F3C79E|nr:L-lactate permease [Mobiluncus porci]MDD7540826.1 L-lactate permease [Mobiluncus porci]MDY5749190.1 L-lactate permease [Mobiluncus porci]